MKSEKHKSTPLQSPQSPGIAVAGVIREHDILAGILIALYLIIEFIPKFGGGDVMGAQWLYINVLNLVSSALILFRKKLVADNACNTICNNIPAFLYLFLILLAGISFFVSINKTEMLVNYARLINTAVMFLNLGLLFNNRLYLFKLLAQLFSVFLLIQSVNTLAEFYQGLEEKDINSLILGLKGNAGNKNILAASLAIKIPFVIYCIHTLRGWKRFFNTLIMATGIFTIFILNARSSFVGIILCLLVYASAVIFLNYRENFRQAKVKILFVIIPAITALGLSGFAIKKALSLQSLDTPYGTFFDRMNSISLSAEGSSSRTQMWASTVEYIRSNPVTGCGLGNWKLASIPYERTYTDDFLVAYHSHNDFLEITAELGIAGGLTYFLIFLFLALIPVKVILSPSRDISQKTVSTFILMALVIYSTDALLNFPMERPVMQFFFAMIFAIILNIYFKKNEPARQNNSTGLRSKIISAVILLILMFSLYLTSLTYKSFVFQVRVNQELKNNELQMKWEELDNNFPHVPNMNVYCFPVDIIKAIYLIEEKQYEKAADYLDRGTKVNPYLPLREFYLARICLETNQLDSAYYYASKVLMRRPRSKSGYQLLNAICVRKNDTMTLSKAFREYIIFRNDAWAWNNYVTLMMQLPSDRKLLSVIVDTALSKFPGDRDLLQTKTLLLDQLNSTPHSSVQHKSSDFQKNFASGLAAFKKKEYRRAAADFILASTTNPNDYVSVENTGLCYFYLNEYNKAIAYFDNVIQSKISTDGKSEFLKGLCLVKLGKKAEGCSLFRTALAKGYIGAKEQIGFYCP